MSAAFAALGIVAAGGFAYEFYVRTDTLRLRKLEYHSKEFYRLSSELLKNPVTPQYVLDGLDSLSVVMRYQPLSRRVVRGRLFGLGRKDLAAIEGRKVSNQSATNDWKLLRSEHPELAIDFAITALHAVEAATYRSRFAGLLVRRLSLAAWRAQPERAVRVAERFGPDGTIAHA